MQHEFSYDRSFEDADQIYRIEFNNPVEKNRYAILYQYENPGTLESISGIEKQTRLARLTDIFAEANDKRIAENDFWAAYSSFFKLFKFPLIEGNRNGVLSKTNSIVLTQETARKYFGNQKALGKDVSVIFGDQKVPLTVTGVLNVPSHTHLQFDAVVSKDVYNNLYQLQLKDTHIAYYYLQLSKGTSAREIEKELKPINKKANTKYFDYYLNPITDIHLHSAARYEIKPNSNIRYIYFLSAIAVILLIIAGINFTSLATAQNLQRYKEAGIRKVLGAYRRQLISQFLFEAVCLSIFALVSAYFIIGIILPYFNELADTSFIFANFFNRSSLALFLSISIGLGIIAGFYPAILLSAFQPIKTLKGITPSGKKGASVWKSIVVIQFAASITMIICTFTIYQQLSYIQNKDLGFNKDRIITLKNLSGINYKTLKSRFKKIIGVKNVSFSSYIPGISNKSGSAMIQVPGRSDSVTFNWISADYDYLDTYNIKLNEGRNFSEQHATDSSSAYLLNKAAVQSMGLNSPIGKEINFFGHKGSVIGVTQNFNFLSLYQKIPPVIFLMKKDIYRNISIKISANADLSLAIGKIQNTWKALLPNIPFQYKFLNQQFDALYKTDQQMGKIFTLFAALALFVSCLGLFSLSSFMAQKRRKEVGIRKVLGAQIWDILGSFYKNYAALIGIACLIAIPISYLFLRNWLNQFAFRIDMPVILFGIAIIATLCIALATVSYESIIAATANPVDTLKGE